jgi:hypothetical protein
VEERELVSIDGANDSFLEPLSLSRHLDLDFSGCFDGSVFFLVIGTGSNDTIEFEVSLRTKGGGSLVAVGGGGGAEEKSGRGVSTAPSSEDGLSDRDRSVGGVSSL